MGCFPPYPNSPVSGAELRSCRYRPGNVESDPTPRSSRSGRPCARCSLPESASRTALDFRPQPTTASDVTQRIALTTATSSTSFPLGPREHTAGTKHQRPRATEQTGWRTCSVILGITKPDRHILGLSHIPGIQLTSNISGVEELFPRAWIAWGL